MSTLAAIALTIGAVIVAPIIAVPIVLLVCITAAIIVYWGELQE